MELTKGLKLLFSLILAFTLVSLSNIVKAQRIYPATTISAPVRPGDTLETFPSAHSSELLGGLKYYETIVERNALYSQRRTKGTMVYIADSNKFYSLKDGITNSHWIEFPEFDDGKSIFDTLIVIRKFIIDLEHKTHTDTFVVVSNDTLYKRVFDLNLWSKIGNYLYPKTLSDSVGIATNTPDEIFTVNGNMSMPISTATTGKLMQGDKITLFSNQGSTYLGYNVRTLGDYNQSLGGESMIPTTNQSYSIGIGWRTFYYSTATAHYNIGIGHNALMYNDGGNENIGIGFGALYSLTSGIRNVEICGVGTYSAITTGNYNINIGWKNANKEGDHNISLGQFANSHSLLDYNIAIGKWANYNDTASTLGIYLGNGAGRSVGIPNSAKVKNVVIGEESGYNFGGSQSVILGAGNLKNLFEQGYHGDTLIIMGYELAPADTLATQIIMIGRTSADEDTIALIEGSQITDYIKINGTHSAQNGYKVSKGTIIDNDDTPDVSGAHFWVYNGTANAVTVTDLDNPEVDVVYTIMGNSDVHTLTINDAGNFNLTGNLVLGADDNVKIWVRADNDYVQVSSLINN